MVGAGTLPNVKRGVFAAIGLGVVECVLLVFAAAHLGWTFVLLFVIASGALGAFMIWSAGVSAVSQIRNAVQQHRTPSAELWRSGFELVSGILLLLPGIVSTVSGVLLCVPQVQRPLARVVATRAKKRAEAAGVHGRARWTTFEVRSPMDVSSGGRRANPAQDRGGVIDLDAEEIFLDDLAGQLGRPREQT